MLNDFFCLRTASPLNVISPFSCGEEIRFSLRWTKILLFDLAVVKLLPGKMRLASCLIVCSPGPSIVKLAAALFSTAALPRNNACSGVSTVPICLKTFLRLTRTLYFGFGAFDDSK